MKFTKICSLLLLAILIALPSFSQEPMEEKKTLAQNKEVELIRVLSIYVDYKSQTINKEGLQEEFFKHLGLNPKGEVLVGYFGLNTNGNFFMFVVKKRSRSGKTTGLFEIVLYLKESDYNRKPNDPPTFEAKNGKVSGALPKKAIITIYDLSYGNYQEKVIESATDFDYPTTSELINEGKNIGQILIEYLEKIEKSHIGGRRYYREAMERHKCFEDMDKEDGKDKGKVHFK